MRSSGQSQSPESNFLPLPSEITFIVLAKLGARELAVLSLVSHEANTQAADNQLWFRLFSVSPEYSASQDYKNSYKQKRIVEKQKYHHQGLAAALFRAQPGLGQV